MLDSRLSVTTTHSHSSSDDTSATHATPVPAPPAAARHPTEAQNFLDSVAGAGNEGLSILTATASRPLPREYTALRLDPNHLEAATTDAPNDTNRTYDTTSAASSPCGGFVGVSWQAGADDDRSPTDHGPARRRSDTLGKKCSNMSGNSANRDGSTEAAHGASEQMSASRSSTTSASSSHCSSSSSGIGAPASPTIASAQDDLATNGPCVPAPAPAAHSTPPSHTTSASASASPHGARRTPLVVAPARAMVRSESIASELLALARDTATPVYVRHDPGLATPHAARSTTPLGQRTRAADSLATLTPIRLLPTPLCPIAAAAWHGSGSVGDPSPLSAILRTGTGDAPNSLAAAYVARIRQEQAQARGGAMALPTFLNAPSAAAAASRTASGPPHGPTLPNRDVGAKLALLEGLCCDTPLEDPARAAEASPAPDPPFFCASWLGGSSSWECPDGGTALPLGPPAPSAAPPSNTLRTASAHRDAAMAQRTCSGSVFEVPTNLTFPDMHRGGGGGPHQRHSWHWTAAGSDACEGLTTTNRRPPAAAAAASPHSAAFGGAAAMSMSTSSRVCRIIGTEDSPYTAEAEPLPRR